MSYLSTDEAYDYTTLACWYQNSVDETQPPIWTDEHLDELLKDFYVIPKDTPTADVVPKSEDTVEVIRCRNCKHWDKDNIQKYTNSSDDSTLVDFAECFQWSCWSTCYKTRYNDYCSLAEKDTPEEQSDG